MLGVAVVYTRYFAAVKRITLELPTVHRCLFCVFARIRAGDGGALLDVLTA